MNSKKVKSRHENSTTNLKQNFKGQTPLKLSDNENQKTNYSKIRGLEYRGVVHR